MIRNRSAILLSLSSIFCLSLMGMQHQDEEKGQVSELCLPFHKTYVSSSLRQEDHSLAILIAASNADPETLAKYLFNKNPDKSVLTDALISAHAANYIYHGNLCTKLFEFCFHKQLFDANKKACICLLEDALTPPITQDREAPNKKRD